MEKLKLKIISSDDKLILDVIENYNKVYGTDFRVEEFIYDEVVFAVLSATRFTYRDVFDLGYQFGGTAQYKRDRGEIFW
jgi:hypothetical protein